MKVVYPTLTGEIAKRGIKKSMIARRLGISEKALYNKLSGAASFTWDEALKINSCFFPDIEVKDLFSTDQSHSPSSA